MGAISKIVATQFTEQSTSSTSYTSAGCTTSALANGVEYLVLYGMSYGSDSNSALPQARLLFGSSTTLAENYNEGWHSVFFDSGRLQGICKVTGDGSSTLAFQFEVGTGSTAYAGAMFIVAISLDDLGTQNTDWWFSGTDSATDELSNAAIDGWDTVRSQAWTLSAGDYIVLMSCEGTQGDTATNSRAGQCRFRVAGSTMGSEYHLELEDAGIYNSWMGMDKLTLSSGSNTFAIEAGTRTAAEADFRRSRIFVCKASVLDQVVRAVDTTGSTSSSTSYVDFITQSYTPNQTEDVLVLGHAVCGNPTLPYVCQTQLYNATDTAVICQDGAQFENDQSVNNGDQYPVFSAGVISSASGAKSVKLQFRQQRESGGSSGTAHIGLAADDSTGVQSTLLIISLTTASSAQEITTGTATETDTALALAATKIRSTGVSAETDAALALTATRFYDVGTSAETDTALAPALSKVLSVGVAAESDAAVAVPLALQTRTSLESDAALALTAARLYATGLASETEAATSLARTKIRAAGIALESDTALQLAAARAYDTGLSTESDAAQAFAVTKIVDIQTSVETDAALALTVTLGLSVVVAEESDASFSLAVVKLVSHGLSSETDAAQAPGVSKALATQAAAEADTALAFAVTKLVSYSPGLEADAALGLSVAGGLVVGASVETDTALGLSIALVEFVRSKLFGSARAYKHRGKGGPGLKRGYARAFQRRGKG